MSFFNSLLMLDGFISKPHLVSSTGYRINKSNLENGWFQGNNMWLVIISIYGLNTHQGEFQEQ